MHTETQGGKRQPNLQGKTPNTQLRVEVTAADLPLHCPMPGDTLWNSHPKVYIPMEKGGVQACPYCGTEYVLKADG